MHPDLNKLIELQQLDTEWKRLRDDNDALPRHVAGLAARSASAQAALLETEEALAREEKLRRSLESDIRDQTGRSARAKRQMDIVTTEAQAAALEHEIAFAASEVRRLEDAELESMVRTETLDGQRSEAKSNVDAAEAMLERERLRAADIIARVANRIAQLTPDRTALRSTIGESVLSTYDRIAKAKGTGIAEGVDGKCSACQMLIRPQKWNDLRDRSDDQTMMTCESCGRLLFWNPAQDAPQKKPVSGAGPDIAEKAGVR
jgi:predicted  nucleic acid-binding Zn-ribbon protein